MNATLKKVAVVNNGTVFQICAPGVAAALTRSGGRPSPLLEARLEKALGPVAEMTFARSRKTMGDFVEGRWYVRVVKAVPAPVAGPVTDTNTAVKGHCKCHRCHGTGRIASSRDDGLCYRCKGKGYTTEIDRRRNAGYAKFRKARINRAVGGAA